ncbi:MAG: hypothetical protein AAF598_11585 [Bacteroidota bacterium]
MTTFSLPTYSGYNFPEVLRFLGRSNKESTHSLWGDRVRKVFLFEGQAYLIELSQTGPDLLAAQCLNVSLSGEAAHDLTNQCVRWLGTLHDPAPFYQFFFPSGEMALADPILGPLIQRFHGLPIVGIPDFLESISWAIIGQQINLAFAYTCKGRLVEHYGPSVVFEGQMYYAFPEAFALASADPEILRSFQFSRQKINYLIGIAEALETGALVPSEISSLSYSAAKQYLLQFKGIGPWTADYVLMKHFRFNEACPVGDAGLRQALDAYLPADEKNTAGVAKIFERWNQFPAFAAFYLWQQLIK